MIAASSIGGVKAGFAWIQMADALVNVVTVNADWLQPRNFAA